ncbi:unnamed protein product, partial [Didymodactylos carnosus]
MSSSSSTLSLVLSLKSITLQLNRSVTILILLLGQFGNILNIYIFTRKPLRRNTCGLYILSSTIANIFSFTFGLIPYILSSGYGINLSTRSAFICKCQSYFYYVCLILSSWFLLLACIDRYCSTHRSAQRRKFSRLSIAYRLILITTIICFLIHIHFLIYIYYTSTNQCAVLTQTYIIFLYCYLVIFYSLLTPLIYLLFGILTVLNVKKSSRRIIQTVNQRTINTQLIKILLIQILSYTCLTLPYSLMNLYLLLLSYYKVERSQERQAI